MCLHLELGFESPMPAGLLTGLCCFRFRLSEATLLIPGASAHRLGITRTGCQRQTGQIRSADTATRTAQRLLEHACESSVLGELHRERSNRVSLREMFGLGCRLRACDLFCVEPPQQLAAASRW